MIVEVVYSEDKWVPIQKLEFKGRQFRRYAKNRWGAWAEGASSCLRVSRRVGHWVLCGSFKCTWISETDHARICKYLKEQEVLEALK